MMTPVAGITSAGGKNFSDETPTPNDGQGSKPRVAKTLSR